MRNLNFIAFIFTSFPWCIQKKNLGAKDQLESNCGQDSLEKVILHLTKCMNLSKLISVALMLPLYPPTIVQTKCKLSRIFRPLAAHVSSDAKSHFSTVCRCFDRIFAKILKFVLNKIGLKLLMSPLCNFTISLVKYWRTFLFLFLCFFCKGFGIGGDIRIKSCDNHGYCGCGGNDVVGK